MLKKIAALLCQLGFHPWKYKLDGSMETKECRWCGMAYGLHNYIWIRTTAEPVK